MGIVGYHYREDRTGQQGVAVRAGETEVGFFWRGRESLHTYIRVLEKEKPPW